MTAWAAGTDIYLSVFCCKMFMCTTPNEKQQAISKGLILVPPDKVDEVNDMSLFGRRMWGLEYLKEHPHEHL